MLFKRKEVLILEFVKIKKLKLEITLLIKVKTIPYKA